MNEPDARAELSRLRAVVEAVQALAPTWMRNEERSADYQDGLADAAEQLTTALAVSSSGESHVEIGGQRMTEAQYDAARRPLLDGVASRADADRLREAWGRSDWDGSEDSMRSSSGEAESEPLNVGVLADFVEVGRPGGEGGWVCSTCGYGSTEHGMTGHPSFACVYQPAWKPLTPAPVLSGGQTDEGDEQQQLDDLLMEFGHLRTDSGGTWLNVESLPRVLAALAARPVLSREAVAMRLDGHWASLYGCACGWQWGGARARRRDQYLDHLADVLTGLRERLDGHWPSPGGSTCDCGWSGDTAADWRDHLADVLAAGAGAR